MCTRTYLYIYILILCIYIWASDFYSQTLSFAHTYLMHIYVLNVCVFIYIFVELEVCNIHRSKSMTNYWILSGKLMRRYRWLGEAAHGRSGEVCILSVIWLGLRTSGLSNNYHVIWWLVQTLGNQYKCNQKGGSQPTSTWWWSKHSETSRRLV